MILSNIEIHRALDDGRLLIEPQPAPRFAQVGGPDSPFDTTAVDLRLSETIGIPRPNLSISIDFMRGQVPDTLETLYRTVPIDKASGFTLEPNTFVLGQTLERIGLRLPEEYPAGCSKELPCLAARVEGKSSRARFGLLIHFTAPTIHAGFEGHIALEIINLGPAPITLRREMPICQLILETVSGIPRENPSQFEGQSRPTGSKS